MKGLKLLFAVLLVPLAFQAAFANDEIDTSRAATRRGTTPTVTSNRQKTNIEQKNNTNTPSASSRVINVNKTSEISAPHERSTTKQVSSRSGNVVNSTNRTTPNQQQNKSVTARTGTVVQSRDVSGNKSGRITTRNASSSRTALSRSGTVSRSATKNTNTGRAVSRTNNTRVARSATNTTELVNAITSRNFSACRDIFFECMDEFCANKDSTLKRCACSARIHDFDKTKEQLTQVEDKLLEFSQRLLTVSMDKEDAMALNTATEGEIAYATEDTSKSKKMLDEIAKKLNTSFNNSNFDQGLNAISLSLNADAAFDSVDSMMGASTVTKSGIELYNAALPICREMALEVCSQTDLEIAESGYQMSIAQDCNTVEKSYQTQNDQARAKIKESSALLDISRLNIHQERNSDDILTCKTKMLAMLTDSTVCGTDMSKCLDISGKYIDPTTGQAILTADLAGLQGLIKRPEPDKTWTNTPENRDFVLFLESKKIYLESATEHCQDISAYVWDEFIEDALAQIKLAQEEKLQQVSQSCTTLTTQCLDDANKTITDFDARALSIFGVKADVTVNAMCSDVTNMCTKLITALNTETTGENNKNHWESGMNAIATEKSYATILSTCREVGKNCIIQACTDISGNFGLCTNIDTSINRKSIVSRRACWNEVEQCVRDAGSETIAQIMEQQGRVPTTGETAQGYYSQKGHLYNTLYGDWTTQTSVIDDDKSTCDKNSETYRSIYDWSKETTKTPFDWQVYRLTEQIWGNCEMPPGDSLSEDKCTNRIIINSGENETLLSWFARNTNTATTFDSCRDTTCGYDQEQIDGKCVPIFDVSTGDKMYCPQQGDKINTPGGKTNCCSQKYDERRTIIQYGKDYNSNRLCCIYGGTEVPQERYIHYASTNSTESTALTDGLCNPTHTELETLKSELAFTIGDTDYYCVGGTITIPDNNPNELNCVGGKWTSINSKNLYNTPTANYDLNFYYSDKEKMTVSNDNSNLTGTGWLVGNWPVDEQSTE